LLPADAHPLRYHPDNDLETLLDDQSFERLREWLAGPKTTHNVVNHGVGHCNECAINCISPSLGEQAATIHRLRQTWFRCYKWPLFSGARNKRIMSKFSRIEAGPKAKRGGGSPILPKSNSAETPPAKTDGLKEARFGLRRFLRRPAACAYGSSTAVDSFASPLRERNLDVNHRQTFSLRGSREVTWGENRSNLPTVIWKSN
jgi:hypothetical protein